MKTIATTLALILTPTSNGDLKSVTVALPGTEFRLAPGEETRPLPEGMTIDEVKTAYRRIQIPVFVL